MKNSTTTKVDLYDLERPEMVNLVKGWGEPDYRAEQIWKWLYHHLSINPSEMTDLPLSLRNRISTQVEIGRLETVSELYSSDGETEKKLFRLTDGETIETVLMSYTKDTPRLSLCVSSQVGCAMGCVFCATGQIGLRRQLTTGEIIAQVLHFERALRKQGDHLTNLIFMGMGEPLHNYRPVLAAVRRLVNPNGLNFGARRITISTVGLVPGIRRLAGEGLPLGLAISLHAATDEERQRLVPAARRWPLAELIEASREYIGHTGRRVSFEWALIHGENDTPRQAHALGKLISGMLCHVNLIPLNPTYGYLGIKSDAARVGRFREILINYGIPVTVRVRRGIDIQAGCGQLRQQHQADINFPEH